MREVICGHENALFYSFPNSPEGRKKTKQEDYLVIILVANCCFTFLGLIFIMRALDLANPFQFKSLCYIS
jgi:hypothetical protein